MIPTEALITQAQRDLDEGLARWPLRGILEYRG